MSTNVSIIQKNKNLEKLEKSLKNEKQKLIKIRKYIEKNFEYVGKNFSKKVREIYYDKNSKKTIVFCYFWDIGISWLFSCWDHWVLDVFLNFH